MQDVKLRLDAWRVAERHRDGLAPGCPEWLEAEAEAQSAARAFHAEVAQASVRYAEAEFRDRSAWSGLLDLHTSEARDLIADAFLARSRSR